MTKPFLRTSLICLALMAGLAAPALAADKVHVGKSIGSLWAFLPVDVGVEQGIFAKYGIDLEIVDMGNGAKLQQGLASNSLDFGLSAGSDMAFAAKGSPIITVAAFAEEPRSVVVIVPYDSPVTDVHGLKGKLIGIPGVGSVPEWLLWRMATAEGWGKDGIKIVAQGSVEANLAALRTKQIDAMSGPIEAGFNLEDKKAGRIVVKLADYAPHFHAHIIFAQKALVANNPDLVTRFLKGFFSSVAFIKANKAKTSEIAVNVLRESREIADKTYDYEVSMLINDGSFDPQAVDIIRDSWVDLGVLDKKPDEALILTKQFVPVKF